jgi:hypothetical protein
MSKYTDIRSYYYRSYKEYIANGGEPIEGILKWVDKGSTVPYWENINRIVRIKNLENTEEKNVETKCDATDKNIETERDITQLSDGL